MVEADNVHGLDPVHEAIRLFNDRYFFEAHEVLEELWKQEHGESRLFLQGLIQLCAAFHHVQNGNLVGAVTLLERGAEKMRRYRPGYLGIDTASLLPRVDAIRASLGRQRQGDAPPGEIDFPRIEREIPS
ncbi:MAG TPA: DUF309 domain-containing protein [Thermoplasmata archaeon]|nr:DUF309 domain-containing protein [Thermoplasmata archaeon]